APGRLQLPDPQLPEGDELAPVLVAPRKPVERVPHRGEAQALEEPRPLGADALDELERRGEAGRGLWHHGRSGRGSGRGGPIRGRFRRSGGLAGLSHRAPHGIELRPRPASRTELWLRSRAWRSVAISVARAPWWAIRSVTPTT